MNDHSGDDRAFAAMFKDMRRTLAPPAALGESVREQVFAEMGEASKEAPSPHRGRRRAWPRLATALRRVVRPVTLTAAAAACVGLAVTLLLGSATPSWAQVAERFAAVKTFSATVTTRRTALSEVSELELWMGSEGRVRFKSGTRVLFGRKGEVVRAFDVVERTEIQVHQLDQCDMAWLLMRMLGQRQTFDLGIVVDSFSGGALKDVTPQLSGLASVAEDLVIYDMESRVGPAWGRIWVLRKSRLPVRIVVWDPRDGGREEVTFTYGTEPPAEFFDPEAFSKHLADRSIPNGTLPYVDLGDPVGRRYVPGPPEAARALTAVAPTLDGRPWSLGNHLGKVTLLHVWDPRNTNPPGIMLDREYLMRLYEAYGKREDFQIVTLAIFEDIERVRKMKADQQVPWLFLCDGKGWHGELIKAIGGPRYTSFCLVDREGHLREIRDLADPRMVGVEVVGATYDNYSQIRVRFDDDVRAGRLTVERLLSIFGEPDERTDSPRGPNQQRWVYVRRNEARDQERRVFVDVDLEKGIVTGFSQSLRAVQPEPGHQGLAPASGAPDP